MGFPGGSVVKNPACQCRGHGFSPWVGKFPWRRKRQTTPVFLPREAHGQRSLVGYSSLGCKELDTIEQHDTIIISKELNSSVFLSFFPSILLLYHDIQNLPSCTRHFFSSLVKYLTSLKATTKSCSFSFPIDHLLCNKHSVKSLLKEYFQSQAQYTIM